MFEKKSLPCKPTHLILIFQSFVGKNLDHLRNEKKNKKKETTHLHTIYTKPHV